jgi:glycosyltransferase involved in cell wall biosynthesis
MTPLVSILIPTYNQDLKHLKVCIDNALCQTYQNIEVIVSDNLSDNGTDLLLNSYHDHRLKIVRPSKFLSMNENFGFCAETARGEYLSFVSSDDILLPEALEFLVSILKKSDPEVVFIAGNIYHCWDLPAANKNKWLIRKDLNKVQIFRGQHDIHNFFFPWELSSSWMPGHLIKKHAYVETGGFYNCDLLTSGDVWLAGELMRLGHFILVDRPLALFRMRKLGQIEVDPDRRLFDFSDSVILKSRNKLYKYNFYKRLREYLILIYRLGWIPHPSMGAIRSSSEKFSIVDRHDLVYLVHISTKNPALIRFLSTILHLINKVKIATRHIILKIKNNFKY